MKKVKWISLILLTFGLITVPVQAQDCSPGIAIDIIGEFQGTAISANVGHEGDIIDYNVTVTLLAGQCPFSDGTVEITLPDLSVVTIATGLSLAPGNSQTFEAVAPYVVDLADQGEFDNGLPGLEANEVRAEARVSGTATRTSGETQNAAARADFDTALVTPCVEITKTADPTTSKAGDTVVYTIEITNCGDVQLLLESITDTLLDDGVVLAALNAAGGDVLDVGEVVSFTVEYQVQEGDDDPLLNTVTAVYEDEVGNPDTHPNLTVSADAEVDLVHPSFTVTKTCVSDVLVAGGTAEFEITITNTGDTALAFTTDEAAWPGPFTLAAGESDSRIVTVPVPVDASEVANEINVTATLAEVDLPNVLTGSASATCDVAQPSFTVTKECLTQDVAPGEDAEFLIVITNTGDVPLDFTTDETELAGPFTLEPGASVEQIVVRTAGETDVSNTVNVTATLGQNTYTASASATCTVVVVGDQGCTPGFWKNNAKNWDAVAWVGYSPDDSFNTVFGVDVTLRGKGKETIDEPTLLEALDANGGGINALARHATAALLNISNPNVSYAIGSTDDLIAQVQAAVEAGEDAIQDLHTTLAGYNEAGCSVNQHGEPITPEED